jgi:hypothetical protein
MLINASNQISHHREATTDRRRHIHDAHTLLRVLCHMKDKVASTFLKIQYHLPRSSGETKIIGCVWSELSDRSSHRFLVWFEEWDELIHYHLARHKHMHMPNTNMSNGVMPPKFI